MGILKKIFGSTLLFIDLIAIILLILASFSDFISPNTFVIFSFLGLAFPFIFGINLLFAIWWLITGKWRNLLLCLIAFLLCSGAIRTYFPFHSRTDEIPSDCIKILSYNVMQFEHKRKHTNENPNPIVEYIKNSEADIICLQEYGTSSQNIFLTQKDISNALKAYPYKEIYKMNWIYQDDNFGMAIFSKFPILSITPIKFESEYNGAFLAELDINGKKVTIINNHLESNKLSMEERYEYNDFIKDFGAKKIEEISGKMAKRLSPAFKLRAKQAETIAELIKDNENPYIIVCGDFNDTPISYSRHTIKQLLDDAYVNTGSGPGITYNRYRFYFRIDYILHSKNITAYNCTVDKLNNSDHYPIWTYLQLK